MDKRVRQVDIRSFVDRSSNLQNRRFRRDMATAILPVLTAAILQALIYWAVLFRANRHDWDNYFIVVSILAVVPLVSVVFLSSIRRQEFPISTALISVAVILNFAIVSLSALRIPISYTGILLAAPIPFLLVVYASLRFHRAQTERLGILAFPNAVEVQASLGPNARILNDPGDDLSNLDRILFDSATHHTVKWSALLTRSFMLGIEVTPWIRFVETRLGKVDIESFDIAHMAYSPSQIYYLRSKRLLDIAGVVVAAPVALLLCVLIGLYIWAVDGRPVLFRQTRRGYGGSEFTMLKFRTMVHGSGEASASENDTRIIPGCRFLRQMRLDELPQLLNILQGTMSWVGPRPVSVPIAEALEATVPQYLNRNFVLPGLTGWAQISQGYASTHREELEKLAYDLYYVKKVSFDIDLLILINTIKIVLMRSGAR